MLLAAGGGSWAAPVTVLSRQSRPSLAGLWRLDTEKTEQADQAPEARGGAPRPDWNWGPGYGGQIRGRPGPPIDAAMFQTLIRPVLQVLIRQTDSTIAISDATGQLTTFRTDGRKVKEPQLAGKDIEIVARWKDGQLQIERKLPDIGTVRETWFLDPATRELILQVRLSGERFPRPIELRRVYDPAPGGN